MKQIEDIYRAILFIEKNLKEQITMEAVAKASGYSLFHFTRTFNQLTGHSPYDYVVRRRLSESAKDLIEKNYRITDIALEYQFNSIETYSRGFKKMFGILPNQFKKASDLNCSTLKSPFTEHYLLHINQNNFFKPEIITLEGFCLIGSVTHDIHHHPLLDIASYNSLKCELLKLKIQDDLENIYSISFNPANWHHQAFWQLSGIKVDSMDEMPSPLIGKILPPLKCFKFIHKGPLIDLTLSYAYIYQTWLPKSGYQLSQPYSLELYHHLNDYPHFGISILIPVTKR